MDKRRRSINRTIDMAFCRQMHDYIRLKTRKKITNCLYTRDIRANKVVARIAVYGRERVKTAGIRQLVDHKNVIVSGGNQMSRYG